MSPMTRRPGVSARGVRRAEGAACSEQSGGLEDAVAGKPVTGASRNPSRSGGSFRTFSSGNVDSWMT